MQLTKKTLFKPDTFAGKYLLKNKAIASYYDYDWEDAQGRAEELADLNFQRDKITDAIQDFQHKNFPCEKSFVQAERLRRNDSIAVVGGQQAGFLTGPLYTVHKIISILTEAERLEKKLNQPVLPVFWIAGEDHDIDEINHTYFHENNEVKKIRIWERNDIKKPASERIIDKEAAREAVLTGLKHLSETNDTKIIKEALLEDIKEELTYTSWCAKILYRLFKGTGLIVMDAHDPVVREMEAPYFEEMVDRNEEIRNAFHSQADMFRRDGFGEPVAVEKENAHLFLHQNQERLLLHSENGEWWLKNEGEKWTTAELKRKISLESGPLSNNVVTRPLMQDLILPVHTFIAGAGELQYWALLKNVFHLFGHQMPIVKPRHSLTLVSRKSEKTLDQYQLQLDNILESGTKEIRIKRVEKAKAADSKQLFQKAETAIVNDLQDVAKTLGNENSLNHIHARYEERFKRLIQEYEAGIEKAVERQEGVHLSRLSAIEAELFPEGQKQERCLNILPFLNQGGLDFVPRLLAHVREQEDGMPSHFVNFI
ncbi:bacillithiol biosynthesis cysteine-adding enzyme BshC [Alkalicoccus halolimnae]|uniref:Putative cysteine ligase BshC n=1 Tax=Alkalicoccus halolimnae TaxID=1667239 RepID=A0A5C7FD81_9BACI|nr:bacillithiol biosynthesis cysteine-adding enzyme BshC [Alkalicoccus halolimnae]TXF87438.1 bacillithiol biosynthesis cysteine-adding enzyme BshC [Alkalicoccus halolimnae]